MWWVRGATRTPPPCGSVVLGVSGPRTWVHEGPETPYIQYGLHNEHAVEEIGDSSVSVTDCMGRRGITKIKAWAPKTCDP